MGGSENEEASADGAASDVGDEDENGDGNSDEHVDVDGHVGDDAGDRKRLDARNSNTGAPSDASLLSRRLRRVEHADGGGECDEHDDDEGASGVSSEDAGSRLAASGVPVVPVSELRAMSPSMATHADRPCIG